MAKTFKNLQDAALAFGYGESDRTNIKQFLNQAIRDVYRRRRWMWRESASSVLTVAGNNVSNSTVDETREFGIISAGNATSSPPPVYIDAMEYDRRLRDFPSGRGKPSVFTLQTDFNIWYFKWYPIPDAVYSYNTRFYLPVPATDLTADGATLAPMPDEAVEALIARALYYQALRDRSPDMVQYWNAEYERQIKMLVDIDKSRGGTSTPARAKLPSYYGGMYDIRGA